MRNNFRLFVFILSFLLCLSLPRLGALEDIPFDNPDITISMDFQDASLKDVLKILSMQSGLNFIASEAVKERKMTLYFDKVPLKLAMDKLFLANNLSYVLDKNSNVFYVKDWGKPEVELETKVFYLKYASVSSSHIMEEVQSTISSAETGDTAGGDVSGSSESTSGDRYAVSTDIGITTAIKKLLSKDGAVIEDYRTNSLIVQDIPSRLPIIAKTIEKLDVPMPQVLIEVEMLDVSKTLVDKLGFNWGQTPLTMTLTGPQYTGFGLANWPTFVSQGLTGKSSSMTPGTMNFNTAYQVSLDLLKQDSNTKYLARPKILTLNNETAEFKITTNETVDVAQTVVTGTATSTADQIQREQTGVTLRVTPQINQETGEITMFVMPSVKDTSTSSLTTTSGKAIKDPEERTTKSIIRVRDGATVVIGGLLRHHRIESNKKVPVMGDIPIFGALFRHKEKERDLERELLIFITPHIVDKGKIELAKKTENLHVPMGNLPIREQDNVSMFERQAVINSSLNNLQKN